MKHLTNKRLSRLLAGLLAGLFLAGSVTSCATSDSGSGAGDDTTAGTSAGTAAGTTADTAAGTTDDTAGNESGDAADTTASDTAGEDTASSDTEGQPGDGVETTDEAQAALDAIEVSYGGRELVVLGQDIYCSELMDGEDDMSEVINEAIHTRNVLFEEKCDLTFAVLNRASDMLDALVRNEATAPTRDFQYIDTSMSTNASFATSALLYNMKALDMDLSGPWWDTGTADFELNGGVYFMSGSLNTDDDHFTYVLLFNKTMQKTYANTIPNPYETVRNGDWTLDYFHSILQGISRENGDGVWDGDDTYGFVTLGDYANALFVGSDLRFVLNDDSVEEPTLFLSDESRMEKALNVIEIARKIYHEGNITFMNNAEDDGYNAFMENRAMFLGHVCGILGNLNASMKGDYGVVPLPKYNKEQALYRSNIMGIGSSFSVVNSIPASETRLIGDLLEVYAILSHQYLRPVYYDTIVTSRNVRDADSAEMMEMIFRNRVYDMAFYFELGFGNLVPDCVNNNTDKFTSSYKAAGKAFSKRLSRLLDKLN